MSAAGVPGGHTRVATLPPEVIAQVQSLRRETRLMPYEIAERLGLLKSSELNAVVLLCSAREMRRYQRGPDVGGPVLQGRSMARAILA